MNTQYADRLGNINIAGGVARLDFLSVSKIDDETRQAELEESFRLVMPIDGIMQTIELLEQMKKELTKQAEQQASAIQQNSQP